MSISNEKRLESPIDDVWQHRAFDLVAQLVQAAVIITDANGVTRWVNSSLERLTGYSAKELLGRTPGAVLQGEHTSARTVATLRDHLRRAEPVYVEILNYHKSGYQFWQSLDIVPISDANGDVAGFVGLQNDVTYRRRMEEHLLEALADEQRRIAATLHDDLGQQLSGILLFAGALSKRLEVDGPHLLPSVRQMSEAIQDSIQQCRQLAAETSGFDAFSTDSDAAIKSLVQRTGASSGAPPRLEWDADISDALSSREFHDVYRIVQEAVTNASRHAKASEIRIIGSLTANEVLISVVDDGVGIAAGAFGGIGRQLMLYRARRIGASLRVDTRPAFPGTRVSLVCPVGH